MNRPPSGVEAIEGKRAVLERELMWAVALGANPERIEQLSRMLAPAANDDVLVTMVTSAVSSQPDRRNGKGAP